MDFGFKDKNVHHAKGSIYYEKIFKLDHEEKNLVSIEAVDGTSAWSTPNYFTSKRKVENIIQNYSQDEMLKVYNCSDVAKIKGAEWLEKDSFITLVNTLDKKCSTKKQDLNYIFNKDAPVKDLGKINGKLKYLEHCLMEMHRDIDSLLSPDVSNIEDMTLMCSRINNYLESVLKPRTPDFYFFIRGAVRHYLCVGFSHAFAIGEHDERMKFIGDWKEAFGNCFRDTPEHFRSVMYKKFDINTDVWVKQSSIEAEDEINPFFTKPIEEIEYPNY